MNKMNGYLFNVSIGDMNFPFSDAQQMAIFLNELYDEPIDNTVRAVRELKSDSSHIVVTADVVYSISKV